MGPNKRAQERERAAARAAAEAKRAEAERKANRRRAEDHRDLECATSWRPGLVVLSDDRRRDRGRGPLAQLLMSGVPAGWRG